MQLVLTIVQAEDAGTLCERLNSAGIRVTRLSTVGSFLGQGNATLLAGVEDAQVREVMAIIGQTCHTRRTFVNAAASTAVVGEAAMLPVHPIEVEIGGATTFLFPIQRLVRLQGGSPAPASDEIFPSHIAEEGGNRMQLVLSIVQNEDADSVTDALLGAGFRVTRIPTAGGFFRRGNATLLIGVEQDRVNDVIEVIQAGCQPRSEANPLESGMPMYSATIFILDASGFQRV